jgi:hypothetical protein
MMEENARRSWIKSSDMRTGEALISATGRRRTI